MDNKEQVLEKVRKIVALGTNKAATEHERDTAMKMAHRLLAKHNLVMADVHTKANEEQLVMQEWKYYNYPWINYILDCVADLFYCVHIRYKLDSKYAIHKFLGTEANSHTACEMCQFIVRSVMKEAGSLFGSPTSAEGRSFCYGAMSGIRAKCNAIKDSESSVQEEELSSCTALALVDMRQTHENNNKNYIVTNLDTKPRKHSAIKSVEADAYHIGKEYGTKVSLNKQVGETNHE